MFQLSPIGTKEINYKKVVLDSEKIGFEPFDYTSPIKVNINVLTNPINTSTTHIQVQVLTSSSGSSVPSLNDETFWGLIGQTAIVTSVSDEGHGIYTLEISNSPMLVVGELTVALTNGTYYSIEDANGVKYTGKSDVKTVTVN